MAFSFYKVDPAYCDFLRKVDDRVPYTMEHKSTRPFIGIVLTVKSFQYYVPLTSPKPKHIKMNNQVDFLKIADGKLGAINFNNMIPVAPAKLTRIDVSIQSTDTLEKVSYKNLLNKQLTWCNSHKQQILKQAERLYMLITSNKAPSSLKKRCCNFKLLEENLANFKENDLSQ